jgi:hypothetical protein
MIRLSGSIRRVIWRRNKKGGDIREEVDVAAKNKRPREEDEAFGLSLGAM